MKTFKKQVRLMFLTFSVLILFQGCTVYRSASATLDEAVTANTKVRIKTNDNETIRFKNVQFENGIYSGLMYYKNKWVKTQINEDNINKIQLKNKAVSTIINIAVPVAIIAIIGVSFDRGASSGTYDINWPTCLPCY